MGSSRLTKPWRNLPTFVLKYLIQYPPPPTDLTSLSR